MNTYEQLTTLLTSIIAMKQLGADNREDIKKQIKEVTSSKQLDSLLRSMMDDYRREQITSMQSVQNQARSSESDLIGAYVDYQNVVCDELRSVSNASVTKLVEARPVMPALNSRIEEISKSIKNQKETRRFKEVFNSIYSSRALQINTHRDPTRLSSYIDYSPYIANYQDYLGIPTLDHTVDFPIQLATKQMPIVRFVSEEMTESFNRVFRGLGIRRKLAKLLFYSALSPRGSLVVPISDADGAVRFNVFNDTQFTYATSDKYSSIYHRDSDTGVGQLYCLGHILQDGVTAHFLCPGFEPVFAVGKNRLVRLKEASEAINIYLYTIKVLCVRAQVLVQKWAGEGQTDSKLAQLQKLTKRINSELSLSTVVELPDDAELDILNNNLSEGFSKVQPIIKEFQGLITGIMPDYLYGSNTAYAANSFNLNVTHQNIHSQIQASQIEPALRFVINTLIRNDSRFSKFKKYEDDFEIDFKSVFELTEVEKAEVDKVKIENLKAMAEYPELEEVFKSERLWPRDIEMPNLMSLSELGREEPT